MLFSQLAWRGILTFLFFLFSKKNASNWFGTRLLPAFLTIWVPEATWMFVSSPKMMWSTTGLTILPIRRVNGKANFWNFAVSLKVCGIFSHQLPEILVKSRTCEPSDLFKSWARFLTPTKNRTLNFSAEFRTQMPFVISIFGASNTDWLIKLMSAMSQLLLSFTQP